MFPSQRQQRVLQDDFGCKTSSYESLLSDWHAVGNIPKKYGALGHK